MPSRSRRAAALAACLAALCAALPAQARTTFDGGDYLIDLPDGYKLEGMDAGGAVRKFKGDGPMLVVVFQTDLDNLDAAHKEAVEIVAPSVPGLAPVGELSRAKVNGHPAVVGTYRGQITVGVIKVPMESTVGVVQLAKGYVQLIVTYAQKDAWSEPARKAFASLRGPGESLAGEQK